MRIGINVKKAGAAFLDAPKVIAATTRAERSVLYKVGSRVRRKSRQSMKPGGKKGKTSAPGEPPRYQTRKLKDRIFFKFDFGERSVVVGPEPYGSRNARALEEGGIVTVRTKKKRVRRKIAARPFMGPAFAAILPQVPQFWKDSVR
jgi:hypothetical protein